MDKDVVFTKKSIEMPKQQIMTMLETAKKERDLRGAEEILERSRILRKSELKDRYVLCIEHNMHEGVPWSFLLGLVQIQIDEANRTMTGYRFLACNGVYEAYEMTYNLDKYRKEWRAWTIGKDKRTHKAWR